VTQPGAAQRPKASSQDAFKSFMITASIMTATLLNTLDMTIANVALPHIQGSVSASRDQISWVLTSYIVAAAIMTPMTGALAARFGQKRVFIASVIGFTVASALCGLAQNLAEIVLFRLIQGICGAPLVPLAQAVLLDSNPPEKQGQAMAVWGMASMLGPIMGPALGGFLTDNYSWRWVFYINLPLGVAALAGIWIYLDKDKPRPPPQFDAMGFAFLAIGVGFLQLCLDRGQGEDWFNSSEIWIETIVGGLAFWLFAIHTMTAKRPFIPRALFLDMNFVTASGFGVIIGLLMFSTTALLPPMLETLMGYPVTETGFILAPRGFGTLVSMFVVGRIVGKVDNRLIIIVGLILMAISMQQMMGFSLQMSSKMVMISGVFQGLGMGLMFVPLTSLAFSTINPALRTEGAGMFTLVRSMGSAVGISVLSAVQNNSMITSHADLTSHIRADNPALHTMGRSIDTTSAQVLAGLDGMITRQAAMVAYIDSFKLIMLICFAAMPLLIFMRQPKRAASSGEVHVAME
jgi:DHA2 family multidrug resistance protein